mgnify:CR=1 FL=1
MHNRVAVVVTCEHASNRVPTALQAALGLSARRLRTHAAYDEGAAEVARRLARDFDTRPILGTISRLAIDLNRSPHNPRRFSDAARRLDPGTRQPLGQIYARHWQAVEDELASHVDARRFVAHVGVHSFVPVLRGRVRPMDIGLLYDPARPRERALALAWARELRARDTNLVVRRNAPYRGVADGLTRAMRRRWPDRAYAGLELELNQRNLHDGRFGTALVGVVAASLTAALASFDPARV